jgi:CheY-like chemotaxis protein
VLVVDDNSLIRTMLRAILMDAGYEVDVAEDGDEALIVARLRRPDIVITDFYMVKMHGDEFVKAIRASPDELAIIPIIGLAGTQDSEKRLLGAGVTEYMAKPFMKQQILDAIVKHLPKK